MTERLRIFAVFFIYFFPPSYFHILSSLPSPFLSWAKLSQRWSTSPYGGTLAAWHCCLHEPFFDVITLSLNWLRVSLNLFYYLARKCISKNKIFWIIIAHLWRKTSRKELRRLSDSNLDCWIHKLTLSRLS